MDEEPMSILRQRAAKILPNEELQDPFFRFAVLTGQVGQAARFLYRDNNVKAKLIGKERADAERVREPGTRADEEVKVGEIIMQAAIYAESRGLNIDIGIEKAFEKILHKDWRETNPVDLPVIASAGNASGRSMWINNRGDLKKLEGRTSTPVIAIMGTTEPDISHQLILNEWVIGLVCSVGGKTSHPAVNARDRGIPCLMNYKTDVPENVYCHLNAVDGPELGLHWGKQS